MKSFTPLFKILTILLAFVWVTGCVSTKPIPGYARKGDIIVLGLGGIDRNAGSELALTVDDLSITITDSLGVVHQAKGDTIFKAYPEYASTLNALVQDGTYAAGNFSSFDGAYYVTVPLTEFDPLDPGNKDTPLDLAVGLATVSINSAKLVNTTTFSEGDLLNLPLEIIAGESSFDYDFNNQFNSYRSSIGTYVVRPTDLAGVDSVAGAFFVINYTNDGVFKGGVEPMVVPANHNPFVQLSYNVVPNGDGTGSIYVTLLNPAGFTSPGVASANSSSLPDLTINLVVHSNDAPADITPTLAVSVADSYYIDMDGDVIAGLEPELLYKDAL